jgi:hypothetical protein
MKNNEYYKQATFGDLTKEKYFSALSNSQVSTSETLALLQIAWEWHRAENLTVKEKK